MKLFYIYPEQIPQGNAREIAILNTFFEFSNMCDAKLVLPQSPLNLNEVNEKFALKLKANDILFVRKKILFLKSNKIFNFFLKKIINNYLYESEIYFSDSFLILLWE